MYTLNLNSKFKLFILILCLVGIIQSFSIDGCTANDKACKADSECCSGWCNYAGPYWPSKCAATSNCGGNCPSAKCRLCLCPLTKLMVDVNAYCTPTSISGWSDTCCKCIVNSLSGGNAHFQRYVNENQAGVLPISSDSLFYKCKMSGTIVCEPQANKKCA